MSDDTVASPSDHPEPSPPRGSSGETGAAWAAALTRRLVAEGAWTAARELLEALRARLGPLEGAEDEGAAAAANVLRHALKAAREEYEAARGPGERPAHHIFNATREDMQTYAVPYPGYRADLLEHLAEYEEELAGAPEEVARQAADIVCCDEVVVTMGPSSTVERFLCAAAEAGRRPRVVAVDSEPVAEAQAWAAALARRGLPVTVVPEAASFAAVARADRVVLAARAVLGLATARAAPGTHALVREAQHHRVPVALLAETYRLTPAHRAQTHGASLAEVVANFTSGSNPPSDLMPLKLFDVLVTQRGQVDPSYISQLHSELYHPDDYNI